MLGVVVGDWCCSISSFVVLALLLSCGPLWTRHTVGNMHIITLHVQFAVQHRFIRYYICEICCLFLCSQNSVTIVTRNVCFFFFFVFFPCPAGIRDLPPALKAELNEHSRCSHSKLSRGAPSCWLHAPTRWFSVARRERVECRPCMCIWTEIHFVCQQLWLY